MKWISRKQSYISLIVQDCLYIFFLQKKAVSFELEAFERVSFDGAGIIDGRLHNPSFFAWALYNFFEKNRIHNPKIALLIPHTDPADQLQFNLYFEYFQIPLNSLVAKMIGAQQTNAEQDDYIKNYYLPHAIALWQGE